MTTLSVDLPLVAHPGSLVPLRPGVDWVPIAKVAGRLRVSVNRAYQLVQEGRFAAVAQLGGQGSGFPVLIGDCCVRAREANAMTCRECGT